MHFITNMSTFIQITIKHGLVNVFESCHTFFGRKVEYPLSFDFNTEFSTLTSKPFFFFFLIILLILSDIISQTPKSVHKTEKIGKIKCCQWAPPPLEKNKINKFLYSVIITYD